MNSFDFLNKEVRKIIAEKFIGHFREFCLFKSSEKTVRDFVESFNVRSNSISDFRLVEFRFGPKHVMTITITCQNKVIRVVLMGRGYSVESIKFLGMSFEGT